MRHTHHRLFIASLVSLFLVAPPARSNEVAVSLRGSPNSMQRQNTVATSLGYDFVETSDALSGLVEEGELVVMPGNTDYDVLETVSYPYARPEVRLFVERLAAQYREASGEKLVVTSLIRPVSDQPRNSHDLSVHPTGIAIDLRISSRRASQQWLESVLLKLERQGLLDVTRERWPPHYHVALFPQAYRAHVSALIGAEAMAEALEYDVEPENEPTEAETTPAPAPERTAAMAVAPIESDSFDRKHLAVLAGVFLAGLFFGLGYWRGVSRRRDDQTPDADGGSEFTVTSTHSPMRAGCSHRTDDVTV